MLVLNTADSHSYKYEKRCPCLRNSRWKAFAKGLWYRPYVIGKVNLLIPQGSIPVKLISLKISQNDCAPEIESPFILIIARFSAVSSCWFWKVWDEKIEIIDSTGHSLFWSWDSQSRRTGDRRSFPKVSLGTFLSKTQLQKFNHNYNVERIMW